VRAIRANEDVAIYNLRRLYKAFDQVHTDVAGEEDDSMTELRPEAIVHIEAPIDATRAVIADVSSTA
jgi:hypothetical protein